MLTDLSVFDNVRVVPTRVGRISKLDGQDVVEMEYCKPTQASSWSVEGMYPNNEGVEHICECIDQGVAETLADLIRREIDYFQGERKLASLQERRQNVRPSSN